jgi:adenylosuccinate lyase
MPHKRNPITAERLAGLARVLRGNLQAGLEDVALWHERDISHSSVERVVLPDSSHLAYYSLRRMTTLLERLEVDAERMLANLGASYGLVFSQPVLLALVAGGLSRDDAYRIVQDDARQSWQDGVPFRTVLEKDPRVTLGAEALDEAFSLQRSLRHAGSAIEALEAISAPVALRSTDGPGSRPV